MTHIAVGDGYLIADKRTTYTNGTGGRLDGKTAGSKRATFVRDDTVKIILPTNDLFYGNPSKNPLKVMALAMAGSYSAERIHPVELLKHFDNLGKFIELLNQDAFTARSFVLMAMLENGDVVTVRQEFQLRMRSRWHATTFTKKHFDDRHYETIGTGGFMTKVLAPFYKRGEITLLEAFLYGSHMDPHSSMDYSVFGLKENQLFTTVSPTVEEQKAAVEKVHALLAFKRPKRHYFPLAT